MEICSQYFLGGSAISPVDILSDPSTVLRIRFSKVADCSILDEFLSVDKVRPDVVYEPFPLILFQNITPEYANLSEIVVVMRVVTLNISAHFFNLWQQTPILCRSREGVWEVVWCSPLVVIYSHGTITLVVPDISSGFVDRDLLPVGSKTVPLGICVGKEASLQHLVWAWLYSRNKVGGTEGQLLNLREVVGGVPVQDQLTHGDQGELALGPYLSNIEWVELPLLRLLKGHQLDGECPGREISSSNCVVQISDSIVWILFSHS